MRHTQYREGLLEALRQWKLSNPDSTIGVARAALRKTLTESDIDLLFDNWLNKNFDSIEVILTPQGGVTAKISPLRTSHRNSPDAMERRRIQAVVANRMATGSVANLFDEFAARIWDTALPNGVIMRDARGVDLKHAGGWYAALAKKMKPTEKVIKKFNTKQLFDMSQRKAFTEVA